MTNTIKAKKFKTSLLLICCLALAASLACLCCAYAAPLPDEGEVLISSEQDFVDFAAACAEEYDYSTDKVFRLTADLNFAGMQAPQVAVFNGTLEGDSHTISNVAITSAQDFASLFKRVNGTIKDLNVKNLEINADDSSYVAFAAQNYGTLDNVTVDGKVCGDRYVGGSVAFNGNEGKILNCTSSATVEGVLNCGGIAGFNSGMIKNCTNDGKVNTDEVSSSRARSMLNCGGIVGYSTGKVISCTNNGDVGALYQGRYIGGVAGLSSGETYFCSNDAKIAGNYYVGGVFGYYGRFERRTDLDESLTDSYRDWLDRYFGGGSGDDFEESTDQGVHVVSYCTSGGQVLAESYAGGIAGHVGSVDTRFKNSASKANVTARSDYAGGIAATHSGGVIDGCVSAGAAKSDKGSYVGGIVGQSSARVLACASSMRVEGTGFVGGIAGRADNVKNCYANVITVLTDGQYVGNVAGFAGNGEAISISNFEYNYFAGAGMGIDGVNYGASVNFAAAKLTPDVLASQGELSDKLTGFDAEHWSAPEDKISYPIMQKFQVCEVEEGYDDFEESFEKSKDKLDEIMAQTAAQTVKITFWSFDPDSEEHVFFDERRVPYGGGLEEKEYPSLPELDGYFSHWEQKDLKAVTTDAEIKQVADKYLTSIVSDNGANPQYIIEGKFFSDTTFEVVSGDEGKNIRLMRGDEEITFDKLTVKYFAGGKDLVVRITQANGKQKDAKVSVSGKYISFELESGESFTISDAPPKNITLTYVLIAAGAAIVAATIVTIVVVKKKKKKKSKA